jgi:hypothetical protein
MIVSVARQPRGATAAPCESAKKRPVDARADAARGLEEASVLRVFFERCAALPHDVLTMPLARAPMMRAVMPSSRTRRRCWASSRAYFVIE